MAEQAKPHKFYRSRSDSVIAGVSGGLGDYFSIDPVIFRILFAVLTLVNGIGLIIYLLLWIFVSKEPHVVAGVHTHTHKSAKSTFTHENDHATYTTSSRFTGNKRKSIATLLIIVGVVALVSNVFSIHIFRFETIWPVLLIVLGAYLIFKEDT